ncbi:MAG: nucleoside transporter [Planctomycetes bacterium]|nr:nucleoside transporter [Planctomycetota bacterium]
MDIYNGISFVGIFVLLGFAWLISKERRNMNLRLIFWGIAFQMFVALFVFVIFPAFGEGRNPFLMVNSLVVKVIDTAKAGPQFVFGRLGLGPGETNAAGETSLGFILAFQALPTIIFFSALMSILYYCNVMPWVIRGFSYAFTKLMRVSGAESLCVSSNIFVGVEASLIVKPHLKDMTRSELCTILTGGMATIASSMLAVYVISLKQEFPTIAGHLISASILNAPAALVMSKILLPESEEPKTLGETVQPHYEKEDSLFEAVINGANTGLQLIFGITALLIAVLGLVALVNLALGYVGGLFGMTETTLSLELILGYLFYPFTLAMGVPLGDVKTIAQIIGCRTIETEVPCYYALAAAIKNETLTNPRSAVIATYALCGFAHIASMAIFIGGISALVPERAKDLAQVGFRALIAATLACLMTGCVAGMFVTSAVKGSILIGS